MTTYLVCRTCLRVYPTRDAYVQATRAAHTWAATPRNGGRWAKIKQRLQPNPHACHHCIDL